MAAKKARQGSPLHSPLKAGGPALRPPPLLPKRAASDLGAGNFTLAASSAVQSDVRVAAVTWPEDSGVKSLNSGTSGAYSAVTWPEDSSENAAAEPPVDDPFHALRGVSSAHTAVFSPLSDEQGPPAMGLKSPHGPKSSALYSPTVSTSEASEAASSHFEGGGYEDDFEGSDSGYSDGFEPE